MIKIEYLKRKLKLTMAEIVLKQRVDESPNPLKQRVDESPYALKQRVDESPYALQLLISASIAAIKSPRRELIFKPAYPVAIEVEEHAEDIVSIITQGEEHKLRPELYAFISWLFDKCARFEVNATELKVHGVDVTEYNVVQPPEVNAVFDEGLTADTDFLFHGSPLENWFSILMNGLKNASGTALMTTGAAYGAGIYMSNMSGVSYGYGLSGYLKSSISMLGVFEVHNAKKWSKGPYYVIEDEKAVVCRSILAIRKPIDDAVIFNKMKIDKNIRLASKAKLSGIRPRRMLKEIEMLKSLSFDATVKEGAYGSTIMRLKNGDSVSWLLMFAEYPSGGIIVLAEGKATRLPAVMAKKIAERIDEFRFEKATEESLVNFPTFENFVVAVNVVVK